MKKLTEETMETLEGGNLIIIICWPPMPRPGIDLDPISRIQ